MHILSNSNLSVTSIPFFSCLVAAGFPSPADDYVESELDLNAYLVSRPSSTFFARVSANTCLLGGIKKGSILTVDRSISPTHNKVVIVIVDGKFLLRRLKLNYGRQILITDNPNDKPIIVNQDSYIWGVVTSIITKLQ